MKPLYFSLIVALLFAAAAPAFAATEVYLNQYRNDMYKCEVDGSNPSLPNLTSPSGDYRYQGLRISGGYIWTGASSFGAVESIDRYDLDGTNCQTILADTPISTDSLFVTDNYIYFFAGATVGPYVTKTLYRTDLSGSNLATLTTTASTGANALSVTDSAIYWLDGNRYLRTCELDGTNQVTILNSLNYRAQGGMATDGNYIYYSVGATLNSAPGANSIWRMDMDGSNPTAISAASAAAIPDGGASVRSMRIYDGSLYWTVDGTYVYTMSLADNSISQAFDYHTVFSQTSTDALYIDLIPEPATMGLLAVGGLALLRRRRRKA